MKCLFKVLIAIAIIIAIFVIAAAVVVTRTPRQFKIHDKPLFGEESFETMGLADTRFWDIYKSFKGLSTVKEGDVVHNAFNASEEGDNVAALTTGSNYTNASSTLENKVEYESDVMIVYKDTTLAYMLSDGVEKTDNSVIKDMGVAVEEITIKQNGSLRFVTSFAVPVDDLPNIPLVTFPKKIYAVAYFNITADNQGICTVTSDELKINDKDDPVIQAIIGALLQKAGASEEGEDATTSEAKLDKLMDGLAEEISKVVNNLGKIGKGEITDGSDPNTVGVKRINPSTVEYGMVGLPQDGYITFVGHKPSLPPLGE